MDERSPLSTRGRGNSRMRGDRNEAREGLQAARLAAMRVRTTLRMIRALLSYRFQLEIH